MKNKQFTHNPYATNRGGKIQAPVNPAQNDPKGTVRKGDDLRK